MTEYIFASESVTEGHPDKMCDQISDAILDAILTEDPEGRVAVETLATGGLIHVAGEVTTEAYADVAEIVKNKVIEIGYDSSLKSFDGNSCGVEVSIGQQSPDIALGVDNAVEAREGKLDTYSKLGAGDQGLMFGYATNENNDYMPTPINIAHLLTKKLATVRKEEELDFLYPDGKAQVVIGYDNNKNPISIKHILVSTQHAENIPHNNIANSVAEKVILPVIQEYNNNLSNPLSIANLEILINPTGNFVIGGPKGDAGLTGRKIIVDTYGGFARHGGGAFSGKDPSKVDRSAAYALRWVAKNMVATGLVDKLELQVSYAIGKAEPIGISINTFETGQLSDQELLTIIDNVFDLRPAAIIDILGLKNITQYQQVAKYGHFGSNAIALDMPWERLDKVEEIKNFIR